MAGGIGDRWWCAVTKDHVDDVVRVGLVVAGTELGRPHILGPLDHPLGGQKSESQIKVIARSPHGHRERLTTGRAAVAQPYFQRLLHGERVRGTHGGGNPLRRCQIDAQHAAATAATSHPPIVTLTGAGRADALRRPGQTGVVVDLYAAVILAGGAGRRLGGVDKPALTVGGTSMLSRVLGAVPDASVKVVVGPPRRDLPGPVLQVQEQPPLGGPVAALAAGLSAASAFAEVVVLAADLPFLTRQAVQTLRSGLAGKPEADGVVLVDQAGRPQSLCGAWRTAALRERLRQLDPPAGRALREVLSGLQVAQVTLRTTEPPPWYDCDTVEDLRLAEEWST